MMSPAARTAVCSARKLGSRALATQVSSNVSANTSTSTFLIAATLASKGATTTKPSANVRDRANTALWAAAAGIFSGLVILAQEPTQCSASLGKGGGEVVMLGPTKEPATGILFPRLCNGMTFVGCGVRIKYGFIKVYAVGTYMDPVAMAAVKKDGDDSIGKALLDPMYPRCIRIVMNRSLSIDKYTAAIVEALEPRMEGKDLDKLEEFKKLNPPGDLVQGAEMEMTVRGNTMLYKNSAGAVGAIHSEVFCRALCDVFYGEDPVSPPHKESSIKGIKAL